MVDTRTHRRFLRGRKELPATIMTYINNKDGSVNTFCGFVRSRSIELVNYRTNKGNVSAPCGTTTLAGNGVKVFRNVGSVFGRDRSNRVTPMCSISTNLSCPNMNPRRTCLESVKETRCIPMASRRTIATFRCLSGVRKVVPTVRDTRTITCTVGVTPGVSGSSVVVVYLSKEKSGSIESVTRCEKIRLGRWGVWYVWG